MMKAVVIVPVVSLIMEHAMKYSGVINTRSLHRSPDTVSDPWKSPVLRIASWSPASQRWFCMTYISPKYGWMLLANVLKNE